MTEKKIYECACYRYCKTLKVVSRSTWQKHKRFREGEQNYLQGRTSGGWVLQPSNRRGGVRRRKSARPKTSRSKRTDGAQLSTDATLDTPTGLQPLGTSNLDDQNPVSDDERMDLDFPEDTRSVSPFDRNDLDAEHPEGSRPEQEQETVRALDFKKL